MALIGTTNEERIWNFLKAQGMTDCGVAGLMGNLYAESGLIPNNLQNSYEKTLGYTDAAYTEAVDSGVYVNFTGDSAGYGLAQWTYSTRKAALLAYAKKTGKSVGDLEMQLGFLMQEMSTSFKAVLNTLKSASTLRAASDAVLLQFERPADKSESNKERRAKFGQTYLTKYGKTTAGGGTAVKGFSNSPLVTYTLISPNRTMNRNLAIETITIHCFVGLVNAKRGCEVFQPSSKKASCNYVVGFDGSIGLCVEEKDRSWCTGGTDGKGNPIRVNGISGSSNDYQAITIEVASDNTHPYAITEKAMAALIELCADICRRNGIPKLLWDGNKSLVGNVAKQNMTAHRWFAYKACPGDYLYQQMGNIAKKVNAKLGSGTTTTTKPTAPASPAAPVSKVPYKVRVTATDLRIRKGPSTDDAIVGIIQPGVYTIVSEAAGKGATLWGKLKSGKGWISLDFAKKV